MLILSARANVCACALRDVQIYIRAPSTMLRYFGAGAKIKHPETPGTLYMIL